MTDSYGDCGARVKSPKGTYLRVYVQYMDGPAAG